MGKFLGTIPALRRGALVLALLPALLARATPAWAQASPSAAAPSPPTSTPPAPEGPAASEAQRRSEAKERFLRGLELAAQDNWDAALVEFMASREQFPTRAALSNIPLSLRHLKRHAEALEAYADLLQKFGNSLSPEERQKVDEALGELRSYVGEIDVESVPRGATVIIDGQQRGTTPLPAPIIVNAGTHSVRVSKEGFENLEVQQAVAGKQRKVIQAKLQRLAKSGLLLVKEAGGRVLDVVIDGAVVGKTPWQGAVAVGSHGVALRGEGDVGSAPGAAVVKENESNSITLIATKLDAKIRVEPVPATASIDIDGVSVGAGMWEGQLQSGSHVVEVYAPGHVPYRKRLDIGSGRRGIVQVTLERDLNSPLWAAAFRPHLFIEVTGGLGYSPTLGTSAEAACDQNVELPSGSTSGCSERSRPLGFLAGGRGGYQLTPGLALEIFLGYLRLSNRQTRALVGSGEPRDTGPLAFASNDAHDSTTLSAPLAAASVSYRFFEKTPLVLRLWGGAMRARIKHELSGTFRGPIPYEADGEAYTFDFSQQVSVFEPARSAWIPLVGPEVRIGYRVNKRFSVDIGVAGLLFFGPADAREGGTIGSASERSTALDDVETPEGTTLVPGVMDLPKESSVGTFIGVLPSIAARLDF